LGTLAREGSTAAFVRFHAFRVVRYSVVRI